ncbi:ABC transporter permease [Gracilibacillus dipsosauri]|uniref:ABC transporter permease n=1 Tax=Gracilibacillus dipsosauri TaxID=178340 RepID=UPI00240966F5
MLFKLLSSSMKKMWKDYLVLLFGLTISIAIFYMFQTLAQNKTFLEENALISPIVFVFHAGSFILAIVTIFYIFYATSFILSLRQKELGMYMTLGAKKNKVTKMMFIETLMIGMISLAIGLFVGVGITEVISKMIMNQLNFSGEGFQPFYPSSLITTIIFYVILFLLTALVNGWKVAKKTVLELLHSEQKADILTSKGWKTVIGAFISLLLIAIGYYVMIHMGTFLHVGVIVAVFTVTPGTYFFFMALLPFLIRRVKSIRSINEKGLNSFTFAQLRFRISQLTKVLGTVAMLIALGLGAMAAGLSFYHNTAIQASLVHANDVTIHQPTEEELSEIESWGFIEKNSYSYKVTEDGVYFLKNDLQNSPPSIKTYSDDPSALPVEERVTTPLSQPEYSQGEIPEDWLEAFRSELLVTPSLFGERELYILDQQSFEQLNTSAEQIILGKVESFTDHIEILKQIDKKHVNLAKAYTGEKPLMIGSKSETYTSLKNLASGTIFMGLFLGVAFLMMMASVLMFKLLSSATADIKRYHMLNKIGVRREKLSNSIHKELFLIFLFPALLGFVHVLVGMEMFSIILIEPFTKFWIPVVIFLIIYFLYYLLTVQMYKRIVLPKKK